jgi:H+/gluconate symporter-like permease
MTTLVTDVNIFFFVVKITDVCRGCCGYLVTSVAVVFDVAFVLLLTLVFRVTNIPTIVFAAVVYQGYQCASPCAVLL